ncbi:MAG: peptidoglycan DD-metalloendopeptidase family protein [Thermoanaerobaculia bacterium]
MNRLLGWCRRAGEVLLDRRAYFAVVPLVAPLVFATLTETPIPATPVARFELGPAIHYSAPPLPPPPLPRHPVYLDVRSGDTLEGLFVAAGLSRSDSHTLMEGFRKFVDPRRLRQGQMLRFEFDDDGVIRTVGMKINGWGTINGTRTASGFEVTGAPAEKSEVEATISATISSSLYGAVTGAGESPALVQQLVDVFQWDIDFFRLRGGDTFSVVVEKKYVGDDFVGYGPVLAARFNSDGQTYEAFRFENHTSAGYYSRNGTPLRKQFLKAPLKFTRITSGFTNRRFHPILHVFRPHPGIDYGAPVGTPVMCTADGVVEAAGYGGGEGNFIRVRHTSRYQTFYMHLSRFASGIHRGAKVQQGEIIGYVGQTGLATGPHLDYRIRDNGQWINPLKMKSITPDPIRGSSLQAFRNSVRAWLPKLSDTEPVVAEKDPGEQAPGNS